MKQYQYLIRMVLLGILGIVLVACTTPHQAFNEKYNIKSMPDWVMRGTHMVKSDTQRMIYGVKMAALAEMSAQRPFNSYQSNPRPVVPWWSHEVPPDQMGGYRDELPPIGAATLGNITVQGPVADERARAEIAKVLGTIMKRLEDNLLAPGGSGFIKVRGVNRDARTLSRDIINEMLKEAKPAARWRDEQSNFIYSLVGLDVTHARERIGFVEGLDPELRGRIEAEMDQVFDALAVEKNRFQGASH